jgi:DNA-binding MarR family transcriptional regulator/predicted N-acetyltransferase YhbS
MPDLTTTTLRRFNMSWSRRVGALDESFLGTGRSLGASRLLFEVGRGEAGLGVRELRATLGLDSGYASRLLRSLERDGLVEVHPDPTDRRRRRIALTDRGREARAQLEDRSEELASRLVSGLSPGQRTRLVEALESAERLLRAGSVTLEQVAPDASEAVAAVESYFAELAERFPGGFEPGADAISEMSEMAPPHGSLIVARADDTVIACGGVQPFRPGIGEIKRMWVHPAWRGLGLGRRMLTALEDQASLLGHTEVYLDTNGTLVEAVAMYARAGYHAIPRYNDNPYAEHWFAKPLG